MRSRITVGRFLIRLGGFVESMAVAWMRSSDLVEFNRRHAYVPDGNDSFTRSEATDRNLSKEEIVLLQKLPSASAKIILFGDGHEKSALAHRGHDVTLVSEDLCLASAMRTGTSTGDLQMWAMVHAPLGPAGVAVSYDTAWLGGIFYSKIPGRVTRIALLKQIGSALKPGGCLVCQFLWDPRGRRLSVAVLLRRLFAFLTMGNFRLQNGDAIREGREFSHTFSFWGEFQDEVQAAGFEIVFSQLPPAAVYGGVVARINKFTLNTSR